MPLKRALTGIWLLLKRILKPLWRRRNKNLENAAKSAFEGAKGASALQDYETGQKLIVQIENEFAESAV
jgi:hypothetical protein